MAQQRRVVRRYAPCPVSPGDDRALEPQGRIILGVVQVVDRIASNVGDRASRRGVRAGWCVGGLNRLLGMMSLAGLARGARLWWVAGTAIRHCGRTPLGSYPRGVRRWIPIGDNAAGLILAGSANFHHTCPSAKVRCECIDVRS